MCLSMNMTLLLCHSDNDFPKANKMKDSHGAIASKVKATSLLWCMVYFCIGCMFILFDSVTVGQFTRVNRSAASLGADTPMQAARSLSFKV